MCRPPFSTLLGAINVLATGSASTTKWPTYRLSDPAPLQTANVPAAGSGSTTNGQRTGRRIWLHPKRPTYRPFPGAGLGNLAHVGRKRWPSGFLAKRTPERPKDGRLVPPLLSRSAAHDIRLCFGFTQLRFPKAYAACSKRGNQKNCNRLNSLLTQANG